MIFGMDIAEQITFLSTARKWAENTHKERQSLYCKINLLTSLY